MTYTAAEDRYDTMTYRRCGHSGLDLPLLSLGLWHNFGDAQPFETQRAVVRRAFDLGVTNVDLANNYGPPYAANETNFGRLLVEDLRPVPRRAVDLHQRPAGTCGPVRTATWAQASAFRHVKRPW